jgi:hypothetical protein
MDVRPCDGFVWDLRRRRKILLQEVADPQAGVQSGYHADMDYVF